MKTTLHATPEVVRFSARQKAIVALVAFAAIAVLNQLPTLVCSALLALAEIGKGIPV